MIVLQNSAMKYGFRYTAEPRDLSPMTTATSAFKVQHKVVDS